MKRYKGLCQFMFDSDAVPDFKTCYKAVSVATPGKFSLSSPVLTRQLELNTLNSTFEQLGSLKGCTM